MSQRSRRDHASRWLGGSCRSAPATRSSCCRDSTDAEEVRPTELPFAGPTDSMAYHVVGRRVIGRAVRADAHPHVVANHYS